MGAGGYGHEGGAGAGMALGASYMLDPGPGTLIFMYGKSDGLAPLEGGGGSGVCAAGSSGPIWTHRCSTTARRWSRAASALVRVTTAWNRGGSRPRAVLLCSLAAWGSIGHGGL
jgi:hypothetical protein